MADIIEATAEQDELQLDADTGAEGEAATDEQADAPAADAADTGDDAAGDDAELVVSLGEDEAEEVADSPVIRDIRKAQKEAVRGLRQKERELAEARAELERLKGGAAGGSELGPRPTLADNDYDEGKFAAALENWNAKKFAADRAAEDRKRTEEQAQARWQDRVQQVEKAGQALKVRDADEAAENFRDVFSPIQQAIAINVLKDPKDAALLRYALGKNPGVAKKLAAETDNVQFAGEVCRIFYKELNVKPRKAAPPPESVVRSSVSGAAAVDHALTKLQAEAARTGDRSKVVKYLRDKQRAAQEA